MARRHHWSEELIAKLREEEHLRADSAPALKLNLEQKLWRLGNSNLLVCTTQ